MNERIDQLIEQCTRQNFSDCVGGYETFDKEKFAHLLFIEYRKQMIDIVQKFKDAPWRDNAYPAEPMVVNLAWLVENHFFGDE